MNYTVEHRGKIVIFTLKHSILNAEIAPEVKAELLIICQGNIDALIIDLSQVSRIDSSGLGSLLLANRQLEEQDIPLVLVGVNEYVHTMLKISQLENLFEFYATIDDAIDELEEI